MAACEKCWADAHPRTLGDGRSQVEHYWEILKKRKDKPCTPEEQCGELHIVIDGKCRCGKVVEYKAVGDGIADDSAVIQAAINAAKKKLDMNDAPPFNRIQ